MKKILFTLAAAIGISFTSSAQTTLPYTQNFEDMNGWQIVRAGATPIYSWLLNASNPFAGASNLSHDYPVGGTSVTDDWYVSPPFSFTSGGTIDSIRTLFEGFGMPQTGDTIAIYLLQGSANPGAANKTMLYDFRGAKYANDNVWKKVVDIAIPPATGTSYIAFRYKTIVNWLDVNFDNLHISGNTTGVSTVYKAGTHFSIGPNPATDQLTIKTKETFQSLNIYDMTGRKILAQAFQPTVDLTRLATGTYILELVDKYEQKGTALIIKQ